MGAVERGKKESGDRCNRKQGGKLLKLRKLRLIKTEFFFFFVGFVYFKRWRGNFDEREILELEL